LLFIKVNKTTIFVFSAHARFISVMPVLLLVWVFACYGPSAFYLPKSFERRAFGAHRPLLEGEQQAQLRIVDVAQLRIVKKGPLDPLLKATCND
jgi:hypothetical protein